MAKKAAQKSAPKRAKFPKRIYLVEVFDEKGNSELSASMFGAFFAYTTSEKAKISHMGEKIKLRSYVLETGVRVGGE